MKKKILHLSAEVAPFVKVGGLSQVMFFLPRALKKRGVDVRIFTPKYGVTKIAGPKGRKLPLTEEIMGLQVPENGDPEKSIICNVYSLKRPKNDAFIYFLENREYYELRANVFGYSDDPTRFSLLARGCLEWLRAQYARKEAGEDVWLPDVIHCHDWHASYMIEMAKRDKRYKKMLKDVPFLLTVHNFRYQGVRDFRFVRDEERDDGSAPLEPMRSPDLQGQNILLRGIINADAVNTVSPTHAREILTQQYGVGLESHLVKMQGKIYGILNGLDMKDFNPATDKIIKRNYSYGNFEDARRVNKLDLQKEFELEQNADRPLLGFVGRMTGQKGIDMILDALPHVFEAHPEVQMVFVGGGEENYRKGIAELKEKYPGNIGAFLHTDFELSRKFFAGVDMMMIPSLFEPGGIIAIESLRYGAVPIVRRTGGLNDIVKAFDPNTKKGNGMSFGEPTTWALFAAVIEALGFYRQKNLWRQLVKNALKSAISWDQAAEEYEKLYEKLLADRPQQ